MRAAVLLLVPLLVAGCLEGGEGGPGGDPTSTPPTPQPVQLRTLGGGPQAGVEGADRRVVTDETEWRDLWAQLHARQSEAPPAPEVDFGSEQVLVALLGQRPDGCYAVRMSNATLEGDVLRVVVTEHTPPPGMACAAVVTHPWHAVAAPLAGDVRFEERQQAGAPAQP